MITLPKSKELYKTIDQAEFPHDLTRKKEESQRELELVKSQFREATSMDEYHSLKEKLENLEEQQQVLEVQRRSRAAEKGEAIKRIKTTYNEEFKPYRDEYVKLDEKLKKHLREFAKNIEPIAARMIEIEKAEETYHMLRMKSPEYQQINRLSVDEKGLRLPYNFYSAMARTTAEQAKEVINAIKEHWMK